MNKAILIGRLTKDPELKTVGSGVSVCTFTLAIDRPFKDASGEKQADFLPIITWRALADNCHRFLKKGNQCAVTGTIQTRSYDDKDGNKRYVTEIVADGVEFLGKPNEAGSSDNSYSSASNSTSAGRKPSMDALTPVVDDDLPF